MKKQTVEEIPEINLSWTKGLYNTPEELLRIEGQRGRMKYKLKFVEHDIAVEFTRYGWKVEHTKRIDEIEVTHEYKAQLVFQPCNYGGYRSFFRCPICGHRRKKLYIHELRLGCRECFNLAYSSNQRQGNKVEEIRRKMWKIQLELKTERHPLNTFPDKPKWMHWSKYWKLIEELNLLDRCFIRALDRKYFNLMGTACFSHMTTNQFINCLKMAEY